jgi:4'-phosphopantetheinyl transferase
MPFILKTKISERASMGVWQITEPEEWLRGAVQLSAEEVECVKEIRHDLRRRQWLACRIITCDLTGDWNAEVRYTPKGAPVLADGSFNISFSHTGAFAAVIVSAENRVGIDIELLRDRVLRVAGRFLTPDELARTNEPYRLEKTYVHWSAKEALYKLYGGTLPDLQYGFVLEPFDYLCSGYGSVTASVTEDNVRRMHYLNYINTGEWMLVYTIDPFDIK